MDRRAWLVAAGAFVAGLCVQPTVAAALQEIRLEPGSSAVISAGAETRVSCAGSSAALDLPVCRINESSGKFYIYSNNSQVGWAPTMLEAAAVVEKMTAAHLCR